MRSPAETVAHPGPARAAPSAPAARVGPGDPAGTALCRYAAEQARVFLAADARVGDGGPDPSRQLRLAARRLRCMLRVFGTLIEPEWGGSLGAELRWIGGVLGGEWERRAVLDRLGADLDRLDGADPLDGTAGAVDADGARRARHLLSRRLSREVGVLHGEALAALGSARYRSLADRLSVLGDDLRATADGALPGRDALPPPVLAAYRKLAAAVDALDPAGPDEDWHRVRSLAEHGRYAAELCAPVFGPQARALSRQLERVTDVLGRHQAAAAAAQVAHAAAETPRIAPSTSFALGVLHATERAAVATARRDLADMWPEVSGKRWRRWLIQA